MTSKYTNALISETSPYLLQHAHNPVNWYAWNDETWELAKKQNKPVLVSIGYSACHWCHVMEHESFEDEQVAQLMNDLFINIKVDREERPDIDQVYMTAVQLMTGRGGWPLNCFTLPDGRPIYGGTYFPKDQWKNVLMNIADLWKNDPEKVKDYASQLTEGVKRSEVIAPTKELQNFSEETIIQAIKNWEKQFDTSEGGPNHAPKFPLPNNYLFLLRCVHSPSLSLPEGERKTLLKHVELTLKKMAFGGIYDQVGGGFARYSTDILWKVPHFEKMLYDNAQLISLYSEAYNSLNASRSFGEGADNTIAALYKQTVYETIDFIERELTSPEGAFYSALDADTEGEEGKFYVWTKEELQQVLGKNYDLAAVYFNVNELGYWEHDNYILMRKESDKDIAQQFNLITVEELRNEIKIIKQKLLHIRNNRVKPGLDDKTLTSWNALMLKGLTDAYNAFDDERFLLTALKNAKFIISKQLRTDGGLNHSYKNERSTINGFLEDYCFTIEAFIALYEATCDEQWLNHATNLTEYCINHFYDKQTGMFFFTSSSDKELITRKMETHDNVIPASNSSMAKCLFYLGHHLSKDNYIDMSKKMLNNVINSIPQYGSGYSNWAMLLLNNVSPFYEVVAVGNNVDEKRKEFNKHYVTNKIFAGSAIESTLPLFQDRFVKDKTMIYLCNNKTCHNPVETVSEALTLMNS